MKYILTGGGSGGHIYPLLSIAEIIKDIDNNAEFLYIGNKNKMESDIVPKYNINFETISSSPTKGKLTFKNIKSFISLLRGFFQSRKIIKKFKPDVCIGTGGYVSFPMIYAANINKKVISVIFESDYLIGRANYLLSKKADIIFSGLYDLKDKYFSKNKNYYYVGSPRMQTIKKYIKKTNNQNREIRNAILFIGGSQGAEAINKCAIDFSYYLKKNNKNYQIILVSGIRYYDNCKEKIENLKNIKLYKYTDNLFDLYERSIFAVIRPSAGTIAECISFGIPFLGIPSPNVMRNHQYHNINYFVKKSIAYMYSEKDINKEKFFIFLEKIINDKKKNNEIKNQHSKMSNINTVNLMYNVICKYKENMFER